MWFQEVHGTVESVGWRRIWNDDPADRAIKCQIFRGAKENRAVPAGRFFGCVFGAQASGRSKISGIEPATVSGDDRSRLRESVPGMGAGDRTGWDVSGISPKARAASRQDGGVRERRSVRAERLVRRANGSCLLLRCWSKVRTGSGRWRTGCSAGHLEPFLFSAFSRGLTLRPAYASFNARKLTKFTRQISQR